MSEEMRGGLARAAAIEWGISVERAQRVVAASESTSLACRTITWADGGRECLACGDILDLPGGDDDDDDDKADYQ